MPLPRLRDRRKRRPPRCLPVGSLLVRPKATAAQALAPTRAGLIEFGASIGRKAGTRVPRSIPGDRNRAVRNQGGRVINAARDCILHGRERAGSWIVEINLDDLKPKWSGPAIKTFPFGSKVAVLPPRYCSHVAGNRECSGQGVVQFCIVKWIVIAVERNQGFAVHEQDRCRRNRGVEGNRRQWFRRACKAEDAGLRIIKFGALTPR